MGVVYQRKYGVEATINFELFEVDGVDFRVDAAHASGDTKIMKNEGAEGNTSNGFTDEGQGYSIVLTAAEMQAARIVVYIVDQTATKVWLDRVLIIETYGHANAQHPFLLATSPGNTLDVAATGEAGIDFDNAKGSHPNVNLADDAITPGKYNDAAANIPYQGGVWVDSGAANANTVVGVDGLPSNPVSTFAAARTLADAIGVQKYYIINHSNLTLATTHQDWVFEGIGLRNRINMGGQDVNDSFFYHLILSGTQGGTQKIEADCSYLNGITNLNIIATHVWLTGNNTLKATTLSIIDHWSSNVPGQSTPELTFQAGETSIGLRHGSGGIKVNNMTSDHTMSLETDGQLIVDATCNSANISVRGNMDITDNGTNMNITKTAVWNTTQSVQSVTDDVGITQAGADKAWSSVTRTLTGLGSPLVAEIWNALTSGMTTAGSIGKKLTDWVVGDVLKINNSTTAADKLGASADTIVKASAVTGTLSTTEMTTNLTETTNDHYNGRRIIFTSGELIDQATAITGYDGASKKITMTAVTSAPVDGDKFNIV